MPNILSFSSEGSFANTDKFLQTLSRGEVFRQLESYGKEGVAALTAATPVDSGETKLAWDYKVHRVAGGYTIVWFNNHKTVDGESVAIILQYGHGTGTGGYVQGRDYINPAMKPVFDRIANKVWKAVISA